MSSDAQRAPTAKASAEQLAAHQFDRCRAVIAALVDAGVRHLIASPGSRSTPLLLAALRNPALSVTNIIDERSAGFFALGQAKATGIPSAVLCTSGSAGAHYYPAVIEASLVHAPLVLLTADRPPELQACGAHQTVDQRDLFGRHARWFIDLGPPEPGAASARSAARKVAQAVATAKGPVPGPVHINVPARKPLQPTALELSQQAAPELERSSAAHYPPANLPNPDGVAELAGACAKATRGLILCGPAPIAQRRAREPLTALARATGFPVLAEASSQLRFGAAPDVVTCDGFDAFLRSAQFCRAHRPDLIIQIGGEPISKGAQDYLEQHSDCTRYVLVEHGWVDPHNSATALLVGDIAATLAAVGEAVAPASANPERAAWRGAFSAANDLVWAAVSRGPATFGENAVARSVCAALPANGLLALGNSNSIRAIDAYCGADCAPLAVWSQRGHAGIDGLLSGAAGAASVWGAPTALLLGDVSFAHDLGGLAAARQVQVPLAIVVLDNSGGRIFEQLPLADLAGLEREFETHWLTPPQCDFAAAARAFSIPYCEATATDQLVQSLAVALSRPGPTVIHARVDGARVTGEYRRLWREVDAGMGDAA